MKRGMAGEMGGVGGVEGVVEEVDERCAMVVRAGLQRESLGRA